MLLSTSLEVLLGVMIKGGPHSKLPQPNLEPFPDMLEMPEATISQLLDTK